jgi:hypothetical protein
MRTPIEGLGWFSLAGPCPICAAADGTKLQLEDGRKLQGTMTERSLKLQAKITIMLMKI